ncbi:MAG: ABC transporter substrate-binding protein [Armatimonadota bacterium]
MRHRTWRVPLLAIACGIVLVAILFGAQPAPSAERRPVKIVVGIPIEPDSLDGNSDAIGNKTTLFAHLYDRLVGLDQDSNVVPHLAASWSVSSDGLTWTFKLRPGHRFHDGTPVNADAVKKSFDRLMLASNRFPQRSWFDMIQSVTAVDEYTVAFRTDIPFLFLPNRVATTPASIVSPTAVARVDRVAFGANPVGSGPYVFKEWVRGSRIVMEKNSNHWLAPRLRIDVIEFRMVPDDTSRAIGMETGELDFAIGLQPEDGRRLAALSQMRVYNMPSLRVSGVMLNVAKKPFDDVRVRQAVSHAIDKQAIVNTILGGYATVADAPISKGVWGHKSQKLLEYNARRAKELLSSAGYPNGFTTTMWVVPGNVIAAEQSSQAMASMLGQVGITVKLEVLETGRYFSLLRRGPTESTLEMVYRGFTNSTGDPDYPLRLPFSTDQFAPRGSNRNFYSNSEVDALLDIGPRTLNDNHRRLIYERIQQIVWNDQSWVYVAFVNQVSAGKRTLRGVTVLPIEITHFREASVIGQ